MTHLVLSQGALLSLIGVYDPFQQREHMGCIYARVNNVRFDIPDFEHYVEMGQYPPTDGFFNPYWDSEDMEARYVRLSFRKTFLIY